MKLAAMYLDYVNNFLTVSAFASYYHITEKVAARVISVGKKCHERSLVK